MKKIIFFSCSLVFTLSGVIGQITGIKTVPGDYATLTLAIADLNAQGVGNGGATINVAAGYTETLTAPLVLTMTTNPSTAGNPLVIQKSGAGANPLITAFTGISTTLDGIFILNGVDYVTINGIDLQEDALNTTPTMQMEWGYAVVKTAATNGSQYNTIKNATVTLNKSNAASVGIYLGNHTSASTTSLTISQFSGTSSHNKFYNNIVQNTYTGISISGYASAAPFDFYDQDNEIGVDGISTHRSAVLNFGGAVTTANGVFCTNQNRLKVFNTYVDNSGGASSTGTMNGIITNAGTNVFVDIYNDTITLSSASTTGSTIVGINNGAGGTGAGNTINIHHNVVTGCTYPTNTNGIFRGIAQTATASYTNIYNNTVTNNTIAGTGDFAGIYYSGTSATLCLLVNINNNTVSSNSKTGTAGFFYCINASASTVETNTFSNQVINNSASSTSAGTYGYYNFAVGLKENVYNNTVTNLTGGTGEAIGLFVGTGNTGTLNTKTVYGNVVNGVTANSNAAVVGGMYVGYSYDNQIYNNRVYNITNNSTTGPTPASYGINLDFNLNFQSNIYNNFISDIKAPLASNTNAVYGLWLQGAAGSKFQASNNSIYLDASSAGANFGTAGLVCTTNPTTIDLRSNIIVNNSTPNGTGITRAFVRGSTSLTNYNLLSGHNCLYAGTPGATRLIFSDGTNNIQTIQAFKNLISPRDQASFSELPPFVNIAVAPYDLHIQTGMPTQCESGGKTSSFVSTDFDGTVRNATTPDAGADEFTGTFTDIASPDIQYTLLGNSPVGANRSVPLFATITDPSAINTTLGTRPRLYYKKSTHANTIVDNTNATNGWKYVEASNASSPFSFTIDYSILFGGSVVAGDIIQYFVTAQDLNSTPRIGLNSGGFTVQPASVNLTAANMPLTGTINQYVIVPAGVPTTVLVGPSELVTSLTNAGGLFQGINNSCLTGNTTVYITGDLTAETGTFALNQWAETGGSGYTLTIVPSAATTRVISGSSAAASLIRFDGADRVTVDGRFGGSGTFLTFRNTSNSAPTIGFLNDAQNNTIQYSIIESGNTATSTTLGGAVHIGSTAGLEGNDNITITNCEIRDRSDVAGNPTIGINCVGSTTSIYSSYNNNCIISNNNIHDWFLLNSASQFALNIGVGNSGFTISGNSFYQTATRTHTVAGAVTRAINISFTSTSTSNGGFNILNNFIGGTAPGATGGDMTLTVSGVSQTFGAISVISGLIPNSIQNNTITKIDFTTNSPAAAATMFFGMNLGQGVFNCGNLSGNTIGASTGNDAIKITINPGGAVNSFLAGVLAAGVNSSYNIQNNNIGGITVGGTTITGGIIPQWIQVQGNLVQNATISNNVIGSTVTPNSIRYTNTTAPIVSFAIRYLPGTGVGVTANNNTISNISNLNTNANTADYGFLMISTVGGQGALTINNNTIRNMSTISTPAAPVLSLLGISIQGYSGNGHSISNNIISGLSHNSVGVLSPYVVGIQTQGSALGGTMAGNRIYDLQNSTTGSGGISGIYFSAGDVWNVYNNMISLTNGSNTNSLFFAGITDVIAGTMNIHHNSIYIGGSVASGAINTQAFNQAGNSILNFKNNLLYNQRSGGTGFHTAVLKGTTTPLWSNAMVNNNAYIVGDTMRVGMWGPTAYDMTGWRTASNSDNASKRIINTLEPLATVFTSASTGDLHNASSSFPSNGGTPIAGVTTDYDGQIRSLSTPDIGADEFTALADIEVRGNGNIIYSGDVTPGFTDSTDFGNILECTGTIAKTFNIRNLGDVNLTITSINFSGTNAADFTVTTPPSSPIAGNSNSNFVITFDPSGTGLRTATVTIVTNDPDEGSYTFSIQGTGDADLVVPVADVANIDVTAQCSVTLTAPTATDNCSGVVTGTTGDPTSYSTQGIFTVTWTYSDLTGNTSTQVQTITIDDTNAPVADVANIDVTAQCNATVTAPTATDNCSGVVTGTTSDPVSYSTQGIFTVTWTYTDAEGNTSTQVQTITIDDTNAPVADVANIDVTAACSATLTAPTATDNCSGTVTGTTTDPTSYSSQGVFTVTWTYTDADGNTSTQTQTVTIDNTVGPTPDIANIDVTAECSATVTAPTATDNCLASTVTGTTSDPITYSTQGVHVVTWTYTDGSGNTSTQTQTITIDDTTPPVAPTISGSTGSCSVTVTAPTTTDNCAGTITGTTSDPLTYSSQGIFTITWSFTDGNGNTSTATQNVTVDDVTAPVADVASLSALTGCSVTVSTTPTATDNCTGSITATTSDPLTYSTPGSYTVTWTYNDGNGNTSTQTQSITVIDCSGIEDNDLDIVIGVYPNPGNGQFTLTVNEIPEGGAQFRLIDELGQVLYTNEVQNLTQLYDFSYLAAGTYYVQVIGGQSKVTKTILITHKY